MYGFPPSGRPPPAGESVGRSRTPRTPGLLGSVGWSPILRTVCDTGWQLGKPPERRVGLVLGGGLAGLACAYELARRGFAVAVLARRWRPPPRQGCWPLSVKGRAMWQGEVAFAASVRASSARCSPMMM